MFSIPGWVWNALGSGVNGTVRAIAVLDASNIFVGGSFTAAGATSVSNIARWNSNTNTWSALGSGTTGQVNAIAILDSSNIFVGGGFSGAGGITNTSYVAKWNNNTNTWSALNSGTGADIYTIAVLDSSNIFFGGAFFGIFVGPANLRTDARYIAKWNNNTSAWSALHLGASGVVNAIAVLDSSNIFVGLQYGDIRNTSSDSIPGTSCIAKWNNNAPNNASAWSALHLGTSGVVNAIAVLDSSNIFVGMDYGGIKNTSSGAIPGTNYIAKWNNNAPNNASAWTALHLGASGQVKVISVLNSSNVLVGGLFGGVCNTSNSDLIAGTANIAKWDNTVTNGPGAWSSLNFSTSSAAIYAIAKIDTTNAFVGGNFTSAGGKGITMISRVTYL